jgi:enamine deaminase RidA (YjgF/YER057c/UK114 family)
VSGGTTIYIAGQVAWDEEGRLVGEGDLEKQARQVFTNLVTALAEAGATPSDLVKIGIYVVDHDLDKLKVIRGVRDQVLDVDPPPASTLLGVERLALPDLLLEVDAIAVVE